MPHDYTSDEVHSKLLRLSRMKLFLNSLILMVLSVILTIVSIVMFDLKETADNIESCTNPKGRCYADSTARTGSAINTINQITVYAAFCSKQPENNTVPQIKACIEKELKAYGNS